MAEADSRRHRGDTEPTFEEWHAALTAVAGEEPQLVQRILEFFLRTSESGRAYLEEAQALRPNLKFGKGFDLDEVIATHDAIALVRQLIEEARCGNDPEFFVWKDIWKDSSVGASDLYGKAIEISEILEAQSENQAEKARLQLVRAALQIEFRLEQYNDWRIQTARELKL